MKLSQMFPSKYLIADDLQPSGFTLVTIEEVDWLDVSAYKDSPDEPDASYLLRFREFRKPMRLNKTNAHIIADVLKSDETNDWIGRQVRIFPTTTSYGGKQFRVIRVDINPVAAPRIAASIDIRPIGRANAEKFLAALGERGKRLDDFLAWCKRFQPDIWSRVSGVEPADYPRGAAAAMQDYLRDPSEPPVELPMEATRVADDPDIPF